MQLIVPRTSPTTCCVLGFWLVAGSFLLHESLAFQGLDYLLVNERVIEERLRSYSNDNVLRMETLKVLFEAVGCSGSLLEKQPVDGADVPNVICTLPGETDSVILVGAHFDFLDAGSGVADNWSGTSLLPSLYESLQDRERQHTYVFVGFTDEEKGLLGSDYYVQHLGASEVEDLRAMINLDTLGLSSTKVWESHAEPFLVKALYRVAESTNLPLETMNVDKMGTSDSESFARWDIPRITLHSVTKRNFSILHSSRDTMDVIQLEEYYNSYRLLAAYLAALDTFLGSLH